MVKHSSIWRIRVLNEGRPFTNDLSSFISKMTSQIPREAKWLAKVTQQWRREPMWSPNTVIFLSHQNSPSSPFEVFYLWSLTYWCFGFQTVYFIDWMNVKKNTLVCDSHSHTASLLVPRGGAFPHIRPLRHTSPGVLQFNAILTPAAWDRLRHTR